MGKRYTQVEELQKAHPTQFQRSQTVEIEGDRARRRATELPEDAS